METIYLPDNVHPVVKLEQLPSNDTDSEVIDVQPTTAKSTKIGEIFHISRDHFTFACVHCFAEFPLFIQFASHAEKHLHELHANRVGPVTIKPPSPETVPNHIDVKPLIVDHKEHSASAQLRGTSSPTADNVIVNTIDTELTEGAKPQSNKFECTECKQTFPLRTDLNYHRFTATCIPKQTFSCHVCHSEFSRNFGLSQHLRNVHHINVRLIKVRTGTFDCPLCVRKFKLLKRLKNHLATHSAVKKIRCKICTMEFNDQDVYIEHMKEDHLIGESKTKKSPLRPSREKQLKASQAIETDSSNDSDNEIEPQIDHGIASDKIHFTADTISPVLGPPATGSPAKDKDAADSITYECFQCHKQYKTKIDCEAHIRNHLPVTTRCIHCTRSIRTMDVLLYHQKFCKPSNEATPTKCPVCDQTFASHRHYYVHAREDHRLTRYQINSYRKTACKRCAKDFNTRPEYERHMQTHRAPRRDVHKCNQCDKTYKTYYNLVNHKRRHAGERMWTCDVCSKSYDYDYKKDHMRTHTGEKKHQCSECGNLFFNMFRLNRHMLTHTRQLPFKCKHCDKGFRQKSYLIDHEKKHVDQFVYSCKLCVKSFANKYIMRKHNFKFHGLNELADVGQAEGCHTDAIK